ncbi:hypothetical protein ACLBKT_13390 [Erythrobacter sp. W302b]|uniref:hypothetical protein n=1 Tax=Erythrobacter sp. W302b TaxID=3389874 RepID=UPI00396B2E12
MMIVTTDDLEMIEIMKTQAAHFDAKLIIEDLGNGRFRLSMSDEDRAKMPRPD